ncbi:MAG: c-type cytochrome [Chlorobiaceae bacterium]|jgi:cytochrome c oxidase cbb3-type subunit III|nr:c-type cytochrome [Chlorobiaceae bacterium]
MNDSGIPQDGHNKIPAGWMAFFAGMIIFVIWYIASYTPAISGWSFYQEYEQEMKAGLKTAASAPADPGKYIGKAEAVAEGKAEYESSCAACHMADASGGIGPNLKAELKYGSTPDKLLESISAGRPNGMPPFGQQLGKDKIAKLIAYIESLKK